MLIAREFIGTTWTLEARRDASGRVAGYTTHETGPTVALNDPGYPSFRNFHIPQYVITRLRRLMRTQEAGG